MTIVFFKTGVAFIICPFVLFTDNGATQDQVFSIVNFDGVLIAKSSLSFVNIKMHNWTKNE